MKRTHSEMNDNEFREAVINGNLEIVNKFLNDPDFDINEGLEEIEPSDINSEDMFDKLIQDPNIDDNLLIHYLEMASVNGHLNYVDKLLLNTNVDPTSIHNMALTYAVENGDLDIVNRFLQDPRITPMNIAYAIGEASSHDHLEILNLLLQDPRADPSEALLFATQDGNHVHMVDRLLQDPRIDPNFEGSFNNTPIIQASQNGHLEVVNRLLDDPRINWNDENLPDAVKQLIQEKRDFDKRSMKALMKINNRLNIESSSELNRHIFDFLKRFGTNKRSNRKKYCRRNSRKLCF